MDCIGYMTMEQKFPAVNTRRRYDSSGRRERARQTRGQIIDAARELYLTGGYAATTVAAIAAAARVSAETIYKGFGGKPGLVRAIVERGLAGEGPEPAEQRSDHIRATEPDPRKILAAWGAFITEIGPQVAPILTLVREAAASDTEIAALLEVDQRRPSRADDHRARGLAVPRPTSGPASHPAKPPTSCGPTATQLYDLLVIQRGWSPDRFGRFVEQALTAALLPAQDT